MERPLGSGLSTNKDFKNVLNDLKNIVSRFWHVAVVYDNFMSVENFIKNLLKKVIFRFLQTAINVKNCNSGLYFCWFPFS